MSRYGVNYYGLAYYGPDVTTTFIAANFYATPYNYGQIKLTWNSPSGNWSRIRVVRNSYGYPVDFEDGTLLVDSFKETDPTIFYDRTVSQGYFYYYSIFVYSKESFNWIRVGNATGLGVKDYGYADKLMEYLPEVYKISTVNEMASANENTDLSNFLNIFGFQLNEYHTLTNLLVNRYDTSRVNGSLIPALMQELGIQYEPEIGYQQSRILARDAVQLYKSKGTKLGLREFLKSFTGWAVPTVSSVPNPTVEGITIGHNLFLDYNDSSFEESIGHWKSDGTANLYAPKREEVLTFSITSNVATITTRRAHSYKVGNKVSISGSDVPLFNTIVGATITAVGTKSISFALTAADLPMMNAWNVTANYSYPVVTVVPAPWNESTADAFYPNKQLGILAVQNASTTSGTIKIYCGKTSPITKGIPVTAGLAYSFSVYTVASTTSRNVTAGIDWYDRTGTTLLSSSAGTATASGTGTFSTRVSVINQTAPTNAYYAVPTLSIAAAAGSASNEFQYFDCAQFEQSATLTSFDEARQLHITLKANRINELKNPHFASPITPWTVTGASTSIDAASTEPNATVWQVVYVSLTSNKARIETLYTHDYKIGSVISISDLTSTFFNGVWTVTGIGAAVPGVNYPYVEFSLTHADVARTSVSVGIVYNSGNSLKLTATATGTSVLKSWDGSTTSQLMPIYYPDTSYTFSVYTAIDEYAGTGNEVVTPFISWYNSSYTLISTTTASPFTISQNETVWNRPYVTGTAPHTAAYAVVGVNWAATNGRILRYDAALFEQAPFVYNFFDGGSGYGATPNYLWENGVANSNRSHFYKNRYAIQVRTSSVAFTDKLPLGSTVALYLAQPKT